MSSLRLPFRINATTRIKQLFDEGSFEELFKNVHPCDPLNFVDTESYAERLKKLIAKPDWTKQLSPVWQRLKVTK